MRDAFETGAAAPRLVLCLASLASSIASLAAAPGAEGLFGAFLGLLMLAIAATDARHYLIPNELTAAALGLGLFRTAADLGALAVAWAALRGIAVALPLFVLMMLYRRWRGRDGLGLGDVKLAAVCGAWLDVTTAVMVIELAALSAIGAYVVGAALRGRPLKGAAFLQFGLFLAPAIWIGWLTEGWYEGWPGLWP